MYKKHRLNIISITCLLFCLVSIFQACTYIYFEPQIGVFDGKVQLYNQTSQLKDDHSNIEILLENGQEIFRTFTAQDGDFTFEDLPMGTYRLTAQKEGCGTFQKHGITFTGGSARYYLPETIVMAEIPQVEVSNLSISTRNLGGIKLFDGRARLNYNYTGQSLVYFRLFIHTFANVDYNNYTHSTVIHSNNYDINFTYHLESPQFDNSQRLYFRLYPCSLCNLSIRNFSTGKDYFYNIEKQGSNMAAANVPN